MIVNFDEIEILNVDAGGGNIYYFSDQLFNGTIVEYNDSNVLIAEFTIVNGSKEGRIALYHDNGQIMDEGFEKNNRPYGLYREWDESGILTKQVDFGSEPI